MPTYEKRNGAGDVIERTVTLPAGHPSGYDEQMSALAADESTPWHLVDQYQGAVELAPEPDRAAATGITTSTPDSGADKAPDETPEV
jgi:hypothetical protein